MLTFKTEGLLVRVLRLAAMRSPSTFTVEQQGQSSLFIITEQLPGGSAGHSLYVNDDGAHIFGPNNTEVSSGIGEELPGVIDKFLGLVEQRSPDQPVDWAAVLQPPKMASLQGGDSDYAQKMAAAEYTDAHRMLMIAYRAILEAKQLASPSESASQPKAGGWERFLDAMAHAGQYLKILKPPANLTGATLTMNGALGAEGLDMGSATLGAHCTLDDGTKVDLEILGNNLFNVSRKNAKGVDIVSTSYSSFTQTEEAFRTALDLTPRQGEFASYHPSHFVPSGQLPLFTAIADLAAGQTQSIRGLSLPRFEWRVERDVFDNGFSARIVDLSTGRTFALDDKGLTITGPGLDTEASVPGRTVEFVAGADGHAKVRYASPVPAHALADVWAVCEAVKALEADTERSAEAGEGGPVQKGPEAPEAPEDPTL